METSTTVEDCFGGVNMVVSKVSIIILNWNGKNDTIECLHSTRKVNYGNYETIVVDNGSNDGSQETIRKEFPEVRLIENSSNLGFAGGMNVGIKEALGNGAVYVFVLNNDTVLDPGIIEALVRSSKSEEKIGAAVPKVYQNYPSNHIGSCGLDFTFGPHLVRAIGSGQVDRGQYSKQEEVEAFNGCGVLLKKCALDEVGLFDPSFFFFGEDFDLSIRLRRAGYKIMFVPEAKMWHKHSATAGSRPNVFKSRLIGEGVIRFMKKNAGLREWVVFISKSSLFFPVVMTKQILRGNFRAFWAKSVSGLSTLVKMKCLDKQ